MAISFSKIYIKRTVTVQTTNDPNYVPVTSKASWTVPFSGTSGSSGADPFRYGDSGSNVNNATVGPAIQSGQCLRLVTEPLEAEASYSGTIDVVLGVGTDVTTNPDAHWYAHVWVVAAGTDTVRATLLNNYSETGGAWSTTFTGRGFQSPQLMSGSWSKGDRIVIELGWIRRTGSGSAFAGIRFGSNKTHSDLTLGSTSTTTLNGYVTLSSPLTLAAPDENFLDTAFAVSLPLDETFDTQYSGGESGDTVDDDRYVPIWATDQGDFWGFVDHPIWLKWTATYTGTLYLSTEGSDNEVTAAAWEDTSDADIKSGAADNLNSWAYNSFAWPDDVTPGEIPVVSGRVYTILVGFDQNGDTWDGTGGNVHLKLSSTPFGGAPPNDDCASSTTILVSDGDTLNTTNATEEVDDPEPTATFAAAFKTVWYDYTPSVDGMAVFETTTDYASVIGVFTGSCGALTEVASTTQRYVKWTAVAGTTYKIMVGAINDDGGSLTWGMHFFAQPTNGSLTPDPYRPDTVTIDATIPDGSVTDAEYLYNYCTCPRCQNFGLTLSLAGETRTFVGAATEFSPLNFPWTLKLSQCGGKVFRVQIIGFVELSDGTQVWGPPTVIEGTTAPSRMVYFPKGSMLRTWPVDPNGTVYPPGPLAFFSPVGYQTMAMWVKLDGVGGDVTFFTQRAAACEVQGEGGGSIIPLPVSLEYADQGYTWFGVRDYVLKLDLCGDTHNNGGEPADEPQTRRQQLFDSGFTLTPGVCHHVAFTAIITTVDPTTHFGTGGWEYDVRMYVDGNQVSQEISPAIPYTRFFWFPGSFHPFDYPDRAWIPYTSIGGMQSEDGTGPNVYFADTGGVAIGRIRYNGIYVKQYEEPIAEPGVPGVSPEQLLTWVRGEYHSCEQVADGFGGTYDQYGLWGLALAALPNFPVDRPLAGDGGVTLVGTPSEVPSCCTCAACKSVIGPLAWVEWPRKVT